ncbi:hypothetical protein L195_g056697 [Trifolium pratense]|uniref:Uncharacterized protein n=1 Tax=Trifolium pratense TaxID=57577 RepID=A0A2K3KSZ4_TRIPR|nr:hypothetical protein L195_g056697 [Trifolium pratense]
MGVYNIIHSFETDLSSLLFNPTLEFEAVDNTIMRRVSDLEWMCNVLPKMDLMKNFVSNWVAVSSKILLIIEDKKFDHVMWGLKVKLIEVTCKVLEAVSYGSVIVPAPSRVQLLKTWFPYVRKMKPLLDLKFSFILSNLYQRTNPWVNRFAIVCNVRGYSSHPSPTPKKL